MDKSRQALGIKSLEEQEIDWGIKLRSDLLEMRPKPSIESLEEKEEEPSPIICGNCGAEGHFTEVCIIPKK